MNSHIPDEPVICDAFKLDDGTMANVTRVFDDVQYGLCVQVSPPHPYAVYRVEDLVRNEDGSWSVKPEAK